MPAQNINPNLNAAIITEPKLDISVEDKNILEDSVNSDVEEAFFGEVLPARSFSARAIFSYDVPEVEDLQSEFVYNFFTPDERVRKFLSPEEQLVNIDADNTSDIFYQIKNDQLPRYVKFSFKPARDPYAKLANRVTTIIRDNLDKLIIEGAGSSVYHTGVELLDTNLEKSLYNMMSGSFTFINATTPKDSPKSAAEKLEKELSENGGLTGQSKKFMTEAMSKLQPEGLSFAPTDVSPEIAQTANDPLAKQTFSLKFNNLFFSDIVEAATRIPDKVFQDEIEALRDVSQEIQANVITTIDPEKVSDAEFENSVAAIEVRPFDNLKDRDILETKHHITQLGYVVQRMEIMPDETAVMLEPLFADNPKSLYVIDKNVRYGGVYNYKVRTVCKVKSIIRDHDNDSPALDELAVAEFLMASEGVTTSVSCIEHTPPPPPVRLRARLEPHLKKPVLNWQFPLNKQRDIKRFQIFRRRSIKQPFTLVAEYDFDNSLSRTQPIEVAPQERVFNTKTPRLDYLDNDYKDGESYIYAIGCVDAHGYSSSLSAQLEVRYLKYKNKLVTKVISGEGAPKPYPNLLLEEDAFDDAIKASGYSRMAVFFDPEYYRVVKDAKTPKSSKKEPKNKGETPAKIEIDQNFLLVDPDEATYQIQIMNVDNQKDQIVNIRIADKSGPPAVTKAANISRNNINFEFGVE